MDRPNIAICLTNKLRPVHYQSNRFHRSTWGHC